MEINVVGYFKRFDKNNSIILVNLEVESVEKLGNCVKGDFKSPVLPNGLVIKHDLKSLVYDIDGKPVSTDMLMGQKVCVKIRLKKYRFRPINQDDFIVGCCAKLMKMNAV